MAAKEAETLEQGGIPLQEMKNQLATLRAKGLDTQADELALLIEIAELKQELEDARQDGWEQAQEIRKEREAYLATPTPVPPTRTPTPDRWLDMDDFVRERSNGNEMSGSLRYSMTWGNSTLATYGPILSRTLGHGTANFPWMGLRVSVASLEWAEACVVVSLNDRPLAYQPSLNDPPGTNPRAILLDDAGKVEQSLSAWPEEMKEHRARYKPFKIRNGASFELLVYSEHPLTPPYWSHDYNRNWIDVGYLIRLMPATDEEGVSRC